MAGKRELIEPKGDKRRRRPSLGRVTRAIAGRKVASGGHRACDPFQTDPAAFRSVV